MENSDVIKLLDLMPLNIYWKDKNGYYLRCNLAQALFFGLKDPSEIVGKTDLQLSSYHETAKKWMQNDQKVMQEGVTVVAEEFATFNGSIISGMSFKIPFKDKHGNVAGMMGITVDITAQKKNRKKAI